MEEIEKSILKVMRSWNKDLPKDCAGFWNGYRALSKETGIPVKVLKKAIGCMVYSGIIEQLHTSNGNSRVAGSGFFLTDKK